MSKPTVAQRRVLERMAEGEALVHFPDFNLAAVGTDRLSIRTFVSMVRRHLVTYQGARWTDQGIPCGVRYLLTSEGCAALAAATTPAAGAAGDGEG